MDLENIKEKWQEIDEKLNKSLKTNEILLKKINYDKSRQEFKYTLDMELLNLWTIPFILIITFLICHFNNWNDYLFLHFTNLLLLSVISLFFYSYRYKKLKTLLKFNESINKSIERINSYQEFINKNKKYEFLLSPILGFSVLYIFTYNNLILNNTKIFLIVFFILTLCVSLIMVFFYKKYFKEKIENTKKYIEELKDFES